eukprot:9040710-Karenia_brevis.AAC.1
MRMLVPYATTLLGSSTVVAGLTVSLREPPSVFLAKMWKVSCLRHSSHPRSVEQATNPGFGLGLP